MVRVQHGNRGAQRVASRNRKKVAHTENQLPRGNKKEKKRIIGNRAKEDAQNNVAELSGVYSALLPCRRKRRKMKDENMIGHYRLSCHHRLFGASLINLILTVYYLSFSFSFSVFFFFSHMRDQ